MSLTPKYGVSIPQQGLRRKTERDRPDDAAIDQAVYALDVYLDTLCTCPVHVEGDADLCHCAEEARVITVRDWLRSLKF